jgi:hypothetical protein
MACSACNHYAAVWPLPGPDSSRESNRRLAQITQYARQLALSPGVIDARARQQLDEVGLTTNTTFDGPGLSVYWFSGARHRHFFRRYRAPVRWIPGMEMQQEPNMPCLTQRSTVDTRHCAGGFTHRQHVRWSHLPTGNRCLPFSFSRPCWPTSLDALGEIYDGAHGAGGRQHYTTGHSLHCAN